MMIRKFEKRQLKMHNMHAAHAFACLGRYWSCTLGFERPIQKMFSLGLIAFYYPSCLLGFPKQCNNALIAPARENLDPDASVGLACGMLIPDTSVTGVVESRMDSATAASIEDSHGLFRS
jgi:hypothetical protein